MKTPDYRRTRFACFYSYLVMSSIFVLPPILFMTFHDTYGISYTLLGTLVLVNFCTQLGVDMVFTFFEKWFNIPVSVRATPLVAAVGLGLYALAPVLFPQHVYLGLLLGTFVFSIGGGLNEVLLSSTIASLPSDTPDRDMSALHSLYAYGVLSVVLVSTGYFALFGAEKWMFLPLIWSVLMVIGFMLFAVSPIPEIATSHDAGAGRSRRKTVGLALCTVCIFLGSAAENTMTNWISVYMEQALQIPKAVGDVLGLAVFAVLLGLTRTAYAKYGRSIIKVLLWSMIGATVCYIIAGVSEIAVLTMAVCILMGMFTSMLWPGTLILMEEKFPNPGVAAYALMAAGGDFGGSVAPQMLGAVVDTVSVSEWAARLSETLMMTPEQVGMKVGMLLAALFPLAGTLLLVYMIRYFKKTA